MEADQKAAAVRCGAVLRKLQSTRRNCWERGRFLGSEVVRTGMRGSDAWPPAAREWHERASKILRS